MAIEITKEMIQAARTYMPLDIKQRLVESLSDFITDPVKVPQSDVIPLPPIYKENRALKNRFMMGVFCRYYLNMDFETDVVHLLEDGKEVEVQKLDYYPTTAAYDDLASSSIMNQMERLKKNDKNICNIIFDMLYDFKTFEQMLNAEIKDYLAQKNDILSRLVNALELQISTQNLSNLKQKLQDLQLDFEDMAQMESEVNSDG